MLLSLTILELQAEQCQGKHDPELHRAAPRVTLSAGFGKSEGEAEQSKSRQSCCFTGTLQAPAIQKGLPAPSY